MPRLFLGNVAFVLDETSLGLAIANLGIVVRDLKLIRDKETGKPKGYGFCEVDDAGAAIAILNGTRIGGRDLNVDMATSRPSSPRRDSFRVPAPEDEGQRSRGRR